MSRSSNRLDRPVVVLDAQLRGQAVVLVLANIGADLAVHPRVRFSGTLTGLGGEVVVSDLPVWHRLTQLLPGGCVEILLDSLPVLLARGEDSCRFEATVTWSDSEGGSHERAYEHDLTAYAGMPSLG